MAEFIFLLCAIMSGFVTIVLYRGYRKTWNRLLLWSAASFALMTISNTFLFVDLIVFPFVEQHGPFWRSLVHAIAGCVLLFGLIMEIS